MISEYPLEILEYKKLLSILCRYAHCEATQQAIEAIRPFPGKGAVVERQQLVAELRRMAAEGQPLVLFSFPDLAPFLERVRPAGAVLDGLELAAFMPVLKLSAVIQDQVGQDEALPALTALTRKLKGFPEILRRLEKTLDEEGAILDQASAWLSELRAEIRKLESQIRKKLEEVVLDQRVAPFLQDDFITQRSGRWVIPVRMDSKGQVQGVVHDVSRSGETAFVEPLTIISLANQLENLIAEQKAEEIRILRELSTLIREEADGIEREHQLLAEIDLLASLAEFGDRLQMAIPRIEDGHRIRIVQGRHPLLFLSYEKKGAGAAVVPLDLELGSEAGVMVITGVNAGGKTIALKTAGLLWLMALSGMPVPADASSSFGLLDELLVDIGDEQSIESSLSTFSAHISRITRILDRADDKTLVLMDELGTSTDPIEGAAIACAVLKALKDRGALVLATTHLTEIKGFVHRSEGMVNAAMEFDQKTLTPLYRLQKGEPGRSHALEVAGRYGLPEPILAEARRLLSGRGEGFEQMLADLNQKRREYERALEDLKQQQARFEAACQEREILLTEAEKKHKEILARAYEQAQEVTDRVKKEVNAILEEARKKEKAERKEALRRLKQQEALLDRERRQALGVSDEKVSLDGIKPGDSVFVRSLGRPAEVLEVFARQGRLKVRSWDKEVEVPEEDIGPKKKGAEPVRERGGTILPRGEAAPSRINLIGHRVEEALSLLEPWLNHAAMAGLQEVTIVHGIGTGILMRAIREYLKDHPLVLTMRKGTPAEGGNAVTIIRLND
jgi:DNA mismatch repair protein MutS2